MRTLAIETSDAIGGVAAWDRGRVLAEQMFSQPMNHGQELFPAVQDLVAGVGWTPRTPELIAVSIGPGSYTGLRVGLASAKMLSYAIDAPLIGVPTFDALIRNVPGTLRVASPMIDAKRGQVYFCLYEWTDDRWHRRSDLSVAAPNEAVRKLPAGTTVFGSGAEKYVDACHAAGMAVAVDAALAQAKPGVVAELGEALYTAGQRTDRDALVPLYLRKPEAEENKAAKQAQP